LPILLAWRAFIYGAWLLRLLWIVGGIAILVGPRQLRRVWTRRRRPWGWIVKREASPVRPRLAEEADEIGFRWRFEDGETYWDESVRYRFRLDQIEQDIESAAADLHALCLRLVDEVVRDPRSLARLKIPEFAWSVIAESWRRRDPSVYGRFDFVYDGRNPPKLLEYNADTPTSLYEAAVVQWRWLEQLVEAGHLPEDADQFNSAHEKLIARFAEVGQGAFLHLACMQSAPDDAGTLAYLQDCAQQAGLQTRLLDMGEIGARGGGFVDPQGRTIERLFKLYPWEWMFADEFGRSPAVATTRFIEPPWKLILSNKGALALLWEMAPHHPNLLECYFDSEREAELLTRYARKPLFSREGADIELKGDGDMLRGPSDGYGTEGYVRQQLRPLPEFDGRYPVIGAWIAGDEPAGMGIREDTTPLTTDRARFVPHVIID
jgi:glutathionylspermidine synthase